MAYHKYSFNKVILVGNLGQDPELRYTSSGSAVCNLSVATSVQWKDKESGETQEETEWNRVSIWGAQAEFAGQYLSKGDKVTVEGRLKTRKWEDKDGNERYTTEIVDANVIPTGSSGGGESSSSSGRSDSRSGKDSKRSEGQRSSQSSRPARQQSKPDDDDDIPF